MKERRTFWDRLWFLVMGAALVVLGLISAYGFGLVRSVHAGMCLTEHQAGAIDVLKLFALLPILAVVGGGLWSLYQALKE